MVTSGTCNSPEDIFFHMAYNIMDAAINNTRLEPVTATFEQAVRQ